jgi:hypothetical protein
MGEPPSRLDAEIGGLANRFCRQVANARVDLKGIYG